MPEPSDYDRRLNAMPSSDEKENKIQELEAEVTSLRKEVEDWKAKAEGCRYRFLEIRTLTLSYVGGVLQEVCSLASEAASSTAEWAAPDSERLFWKIRADKAEAESLALKKELARFPNNQCPSCGYPKDDPVDGYVGMMAERDALQAQLEQANRIYGHRESEVKTMREENDALQGQCAALREALEAAKISIFKSPEPFEPGDIELRDIAVNKIGAVMFATSQAASDYRAAVEKPLRDALEKIAALRIVDVIDGSGPEDSTPREKGYLAFAGRANTIAVDAIAALEYRRIK